MMYRRINERRRRSLIDRLMDAEQEMQPAGPTGPTQWEMLVCLQPDDWQRYQRWITDHLHFFTEAIAAGVYILGTRFPAALTGMWHLDAEWQARADALDAEYHYLLTQAEAAYRAQQESHP